MIQELSLIVHELGFVEVKELHPTQHTLIITRCLDIPEGREPNIQLVLPQWIHATKKAGSPQLTEHYSPGKLCAGMIVYAEIDELEKRVLQSLIVCHGGQYKDDPFPYITHYIVTTSDSPFYSTAMERNITVLHPEWFQDIVRLNRPIPQYLYQFPEPPILQNDYQQRQLPPANPSEQAFLRNHSFYFDPNLPSPELGEMKKKLQEAGATILDRFDKDLVTCAVTNVRSGETYVRAEEKRKWVGTLRWVSDVLAYGDILSPKLRILHYPRPKNYLCKPDDYDKPVLAFRNINDTASVSTMATHLGFACDRIELDKKTTHVICGTLINEEDMRIAVNALDVPILNHLWVEDCYAQWKMLERARVYYLAFPLCLNTIIGHTPVPEAIVEKTFKIEARELTVAARSNGTPRIQKYHAIDGQGTKTAAATPTTDRKQSIGKLISEGENNSDSTTPSSMSLQPPISDVLPPTAASGTFRTPSQHSAGDEASLAITHDGSVLRTTPASVLQPIQPSSALSEEEKPHEL
ncbi:hypothetical protein SeMB42_g03656 [Synchytrium endobioticum]|uniref:BRCT domain-containing protein n=1 Tax=Synchytrium endobioticum TaxID=286115 RepID=A0A507D550_9FUNG|nr:hypothetical protein SeMB42_g03656 [Synchytrium endobioticum]TPX50339.1 hypothetical protein SeLEV6574_g00938 [Synchytrium endobioticum]